MTQPVSAVPGHETQCTKKEREALSLPFLSCEGIGDLFFVDSRSACHRDGGTAFAVMVLQAMGQVM